MQRPVRTKNIDPQSPITYLEKGNEKYAEEKYDEAIEAFSKIPINDTNFALARLEVALCHYQKEDYKKSTSCSQ